MSKNDRMLTQTEIDNLLKDSDELSSLLKPSKTKKKENSFVDDLELDIGKIEKDLLYSNQSVKKSMARPVTSFRLKPLIVDDNVYICGEDNSEMMKNIMYRSYPAAPRLILTCPKCKATFLV